QRTGRCRKAQSEKQGLSRRPRASMAAKLNPNTLYVREPERADAGDESSDSDGEPEESSHKLIRKVSTSGQIRAK
ncbi:diacylglycerol kinase eta-like, partial [Clarias magur]